MEGPWAYIARETTPHDADPKTVGFDREHESIDMAAKLAAWQTAGDERL